MAPLDPETEAARHRIRDVERLQFALSAQWPAARGLTRPRWQFTLGQLIFVNTILAVALAMCQVLAPSLLAGALGLIAFSLFAFAIVYQPDRQVVYVVEWVLILVYVLVAGIACCAVSVCGRSVQCADSVSTEHSERSLGTVHQPWFVPACQSRRQAGNRRPACRAARKANFLVAESYRFGDNRSGMRDVMRHS